jgi:hypothetical protein
MKWIGIVVGVLLGVLALAAIVGATLPKGHVARRAAHIAKMPDELWATMIDFGAATSWRSDVSNVEMLPLRDGHTVFRETTRQGPVTFEVVEQIAPRRLLVKVADRDAPFSGTWTYLLEPEAAGTRVTITERGEVPNPIFRLLSKLFFDPHTSMERYLVALGRRHGQEITVEAQ